MKLKKGHWIIAYRERQSDSWNIVDNPKGGWAADPFLFSLNDNLYLFAEIWSYKMGRGYIGCCKWKGNGFEEWKEVIKESWHLSYPYVFSWGEKIYMLPEQYQSGEIAIYECEKFPYHWKRLKSLVSDGQYVDSTILFKEKEAWLFSLRLNSKDHSEGQLVRSKLKSTLEIDSFETIVEQGGMYHRPGGKFLYRNGTTIRVAQNCKSGYGSGLIMYKVIQCDDDRYDEIKIDESFPEDYQVKGYNENYFIGVHTYNTCGNLEVIDLRRMVFAPSEFLWRVIRKAKKINVRQTYRYKGINHYL